MNDEVKAAVERFRSLQYCRVTTGNGVGNPARWPIEQLYWDDAEMLARAYLADLAAREAEEWERALPITGAWLTSIGFELTEFKRGPLFIRSEDHAVEITEGKVWLRGFRSKNPPFVLGMCETTTRGQILDLLAGLKIPTKGGEA